MNNIKELDDETLFINVLYYMYFFYPSIKYYEFCKIIFNKYRIGEKTINNLCLLLYKLNKEPEFKFVLAENCYHELLNRNLNTSFIQKILLIHDIID